jgi:hypothetical protein
VSLSVGPLSSLPLVATPPAWGERGGEKRRKRENEMRREKRRGGGGRGRSERRASMAIVAVLPFEGSSRGFYLYQWFLFLSLVLVSSDRNIPTASSRQFRIW